MIRIRAHGGDACLACGDAGDQFPGVHAYAHESGQDSPLQRGGGHDGRPCDDAHGHAARPDAREDGHGAH